MVGEMNKPHDFLRDFTKFELTIIADAQRKLSRLRKRRGVPVDEAALLWRVN
jgi:hypothetical protein